MFKSRIKLESQASVIGLLIVFVSFYYRFQKRSFLITTHSFWNFKKQITIVFINDRFYKNDLRPFFIRLFFKKAIIFEKRLLTIVNEGSSLMIVSETTNSIKTIVFKTSVLFLIFRRRFHNETIVIQKNENVNIPKYKTI